MNVKLLKPFVVEEVQDALSHMGPLKALGPNGFSVGLFQKYWKTIGKDICQAIIETLNSGVMLDELNSTNIALIPKVKSPSTVTNFRPISFCNVLYKLISKVLANRLKKIFSQYYFPGAKCLYP
jgi:hypothetical protein